MAIKGTPNTPLTLGELIEAKDARIAALEAELAPWREMVRQVDELQAQEPTSFEIHISWDKTEHDRCWVDVEREKGKGAESRWHTIADGEGPTLPAAVNAAYRRFKGVGDE